VKSHPRHCIQLVQAAELSLSYLEETQSATTQMFFSKPTSVLSEIGTTNANFFKALLILLGLTCAMTCLIRVEYFILFIVVVFAIVSYSSQQVQSDAHREMQCYVKERLQ